MNNEQICMLLSMMVYSAGLVKLRFLMSDEMQMLFLEDMQKSEKYF